jgi:exoribonuclease R
MVELGVELSATERRANEATRDVEQWLKCEYMRDKVGETFNGVTICLSSKLTEATCIVMVSPKRKTLPPR